MALSNTLDTITREADLIADALRTIDRDHTEALTKLASDHRAKRQELVVELANLNKALRALKAPVVTVSRSANTGKALSDEHREKIRQGLARHAAKKAESKAVSSLSALTPTPSSSHAEAATEGHGAPVAKSVTSAVQDAVSNTRATKLTELEHDVLVNGILRNNFQDGAEGEQAIWSDQIVSNGRMEKVTAKQLPGVVASLVKKGLLTSDGEAVQLTDSGISVARAAAAKKAVQ